MHPQKKQQQNPTKNKNKQNTHTQTLPIFYTDDINKFYKFSLFYDSMFVDAQYVQLNWFLTLCHCKIFIVLKFTAELKFSQA